MSIHLLQPALCRAPYPEGVVHAIVRVGHRGAQARMREYCVSSLATPRILCGIAREVVGPHPVRESTWDGGARAREENGQAEPRNGAPKAKTPPSAPISQ